MDYNEDADDYAAHRRVHGRVLRELYRQGGLVPTSTLLEVGCGTGNYVRALARSCRCTAFGLDPAAAMLLYGRAQPERVTWLLGRAEHLNFADNTFDLTFSVDVIHHVSDKAAFFGEVARTLRPGGQVCTVTDSEECIRQREVLSGYFPETVAFELARYPRIGQLQVWMAAAGLEVLSTVIVKEPYEVTSIQPFRDKAYSSLHLISEAAWRDGLEHLAHDLACGPIRGTSRYACVWGYKSGR